MLQLASEVYEGLQESEIHEIEAIISKRGDFQRIHTAIYSCPIK